MGMARECAIQYSIVLTTCSGRWARVGCRRGPRPNGARTTHRCGDGFTDEIGLSGSLLPGQGGQSVTDVCGVDGHGRFGGELVS